MQSGWDPEFAFLKKRSVKDFKLQTQGKTKIQKASLSTKKKLLSLIAPEKRFLKTKPKTNPVGGCLTMQIRFSNLQYFLLKLEHWLRNGRPKKNGWQHMGILIRLRTLFCKDCWLKSPFFLPISNEVMFFLKEALRASS